MQTPDVTATEQKAGIVTTGPDMIELQLHIVEQDVLRNIWDIDSDRSDVCHFQRIEKIKHCIVNIYANMLRLRRPVTGPIMCVNSCF